MINNQKSTLAHGVDARTAQKSHFKMSTNFGKKYHHVNLDILYLLTKIVSRKINGLCKKDNFWCSKTDIDDTIFFNLFYICHRIYHFSAKLCG
jgi:hypothetical protein